MPDLHELALSVDQAAEEVRALRAAVRRRTRMLAVLLAAVLVVGTGVSTAGFLFTRGVHCAFYEDLQPPPGQPQPVGEYGQRILRDAQTAAARLHC